jgi:Bacterial regulatory helix-turn-helix protein, lysR family
MKGVTVYDPELLRTFLAVAQSLSFTRAAASLGLGQPTVSQHVRKRWGARCSCVTPAASR